MKEFDYIKALYRRNNNNEVCVWSISKHDTLIIRIVHGILNKTLIEDFITANNIDTEIKSRINAKRKTGYKYLSEVKDNVSLPVKEELYNYLNKYLPFERTSSDGSVLPMLAKVYESKSVFSKCSRYLGQYKINGLRCIIGVTRTNNIFSEYKLTFQSRENVYWNSLDNLNEYLLKVLPPKLVKDMYEQGWKLDGEIYLPGYTVNEIDHFVKDSRSFQNTKLQFWCYDIIIPDCVQTSRLEILYDNLNEYRQTFTSKESHLNNNNRLVILPCEAIYDDDDAIKFRDKYISYKFEGLILRNPDKEYQYGKRNSTMIKFKKSTDGKFTIVDIKPEGYKRPDIPLLVCRNDINDALFDVHLSASLPAQREILKNKDKYIGKELFIEYGERSGVNKVPFHVKNVQFA